MEGPALTLEQTRDALREVVENIKKPENMAKLNTTMALAGDDPMKRMFLLAPLVSDMQKDVINKYGFSPDQAGLMRFITLMKEYEEQDAEIKEMGNFLKSTFMPGFSSSN